MTKLSADPKFCLSSEDHEIQRKCESILNSSMVFKELKYNKGIFVVVNNCRNSRQIEQFY